MSNVKQYRKKPVVIEAIQVTEFNYDAIEDFMDTPPDAGWLDGIGNRLNTVEIITLEGVMIANVGDYIIKGVQGEFYPCKPDIFEATYEQV
jgi:hypothetical protein